SVREYDDGAAAVHCTVLVHHLSGRFIFALEYNLAHSPVQLASAQLLDLFSGVGGHSNLHFRSTARPVLCPHTRHSIHHSPFCLGLKASINSSTWRRVVGVGKSTMPPWPYSASVRSDRNDHETVFSKSS